MYLSFLCLADVKMAVDEKTEYELLDWNVDTEVQLFHAMRGHKPIGVNRYFQMACIHEKFSNSLNREVNSQRIWDRLETMYDMAALHESEILPFPNEELEFTLPHGDFGKLLADRNGGESVPIPASVKVKPEPKRPDPHEGRSKSGKEVYSGGKTKLDNYSSSNSTTSTSSNVSSKQCKVEAPVPAKNVKSEEKVKDTPESGKTKVESKKETVISAPAKSSNAVAVKSETPKSSKHESKSGKEQSNKSSKSEEKGSKNRSENMSTPKTSRSDSTSSSSSKTSKADLSTPSTSGSSGSSKPSKSESSQKKKEDKHAKEAKSNKSDPDDIPLSKISVPKSKRHEVKEESASKRKRPTRTPESSSSSSSRGNTPTAKRRRT